MHNLNISQYDKTESTSISRGKEKESNPALGYLAVMITINVNTTALDLDSFYLHKEDNPVILRSQS